MLFPLIKVISTGGGITVKLLLLKYVVRLHMINNIINELQKINLKIVFVFASIEFSIPQSFLENFQILWWIMLPYANYGILIIRLCAHCLKCLE